MIGARKFGQFQDNLASLNVQWTPAQLGQTDAASRIEMGFPHEFLRREFARNYLHGGLWDCIDKSRVAAAC